MRRARLMDDSMTQGIEMTSQRYQPYSFEIPNTVRTEYSIDSAKQTGETFIILYVQLISHDSIIQSLYLLADFFRRWKVRVMSIEFSWLDYFSFEKTDPIGENLSRKRWDNRIAIWLEDFELELSILTFRDRHKTTAKILYSISPSLYTKAHHLSKCHNRDRESLFRRRKKFRSMIERHSNKKYIFTIVKVIKCQYPLATISNHMQILKSELQQIQFIVNSLKDYPDVIPCVSWNPRSWNTFRITE